MITLYTLRGLSESTNTPIKTVHDLPKLREACTYFGWNQSANDINEFIINYNKRLEEEYVVRDTEVTKDG